MNQPHTTGTDVAGPGEWIRGLLTSPYVWGGIATVAFYQAIPHLPVHRELAERYFCAHPVEYVQTALFFIGLFILLRKLLGLRAERAAMRTCVLTPAAAPSVAVLTTGNSSPRPGAAMQSAIEGWRGRLSGALQRTAIARRLADVGSYLQQRPAADGLESELKDLDQRAGDELHDSYALLQTIHWAIPIMGFLGTVLGITMAIFELDVNNLDSSLSSVTFNLAVAFDTTAVALCHSLILVFLYLFVKRQEERVLGQVADFCRRHVLALLPPASPAASPLIEAEAAAANLLVERTGALIESQTHVWADAIEALRERWTSTLDAQQQSLTAALTAGTQATLGHHADRLADQRNELVQALEQLSRQRAEAEAALHAQEAALLGRWEAGTQQLAAVLTAAQQAADERTERMLSELTAQFDGWKSQLQSAAGALEHHMDRLTRQEELLCGLLERGGDIISLERGLTDNLQALRAAETFEQTMHSLSAAVHLLTAHARQRAA